MKNDVVRWNAVQTTATTTKTTKTIPSKITNHNTSNNDDYAYTPSRSRTHVANGTAAKRRQHVAASTLATQTTTTTPTIRNASFAKPIKCDKSKNLNKNSLLVFSKHSNHKEESNNALSRHSPLSLSSSSPSSLNVVQQHHPQQQQHFVVGRGQHKRRTATSILLYVLEISAVVFLCNSLNVGFALAANVGVASVANDNSISVAELPYELDYEQQQHTVGGSNDDDDSSNSTTSHYTHTWAVHIPQGDSGVANEVAREHGFVNLGKIFDDHYHFAHHKVSKRSLTPASSHQSRLDDDHRVHWAKQQTAKSRRKRDFIRMRPSRTSSRALSLVDAVPFSDPKWSQMWYLNRGGGLDMNVIPAWKEGITGKGIVVTILDDGLESDHPDIEHNYDPKASYDVNSHDDDPMPHYDMTDSNRHGTRCAGEVAATANNSICAVGIAYGASVGGVRMLDGDVTDAVEARSLSLNPQHIDIYSASWGPDDDGKTVDGPGELASRAFIEGVTKGRSGKGSIFIWASGNGGRELDNCNCDGYTNSIWTLSISSATEEGHVPWYSEKCSSTLATTYSSGGQSEKQVVTTDLHHSCTVSHTGTSASAPLAAGIAALVLESNQNLTWRDLQHIVVRTAKPANLKDVTWSKNGVGRRISHSFGYGLMDAAAMVRVARTWKTVPEQQRCEINAPHVDKVIPPKSYITLQLTVKHCLSVNYLEHVQAKITLTSQRRGDIQLYLKSPAGTKVTLLTSRIHDVSRSGFNQWPFMSVHTWGESPHGNWQLEIHNEGRYMGHALLREWSLIFYGTTLPIDPSDPVSTPRANSAEITTPNSSTASTTTNLLHQVYSPQYPRIPPNNFGTSNGGIGPSLGGKYPGKLPPNKSVYVTPGGSTHNPLFGGAGGGGNQKKQQQSKQQQQQQTYQQISATYGVILGSQNKNKGGNGNKGKGKSGENNGNNKGNKNSNGGTKNGSNRKEPTTAPNSKNKFYRISQNQQNNNNNNDNNPNSNKTPKSNTKTQNGGGGSAQRPKAQSAEKLQSSYEDKMSRKVIGDLPSAPNSNPKIPLKSIASQITGYTKLPVKATKQVKESHMPPPQSLPPVQTHEKLTAASDDASDQRIPKLFERYEKIQAIFPEFQPYQGPREKEPASSVAGSTTSIDKRKQVQNYEAETFRPISTNGGGSKPSRENSKKSSPSFSPDMKIIKKQQLLLAAAGVSGGTQRPMSVVAVSPNRKSTNAQITQWDLIFYGTDTPAQPDDPVQINSGPFGPFGNDMEHNDIEYDASGQWRNMQQVGESSVMSNDKTNTACLKATIDQRCLACAPPTYLFNGRCYDECPSHTYPLPASDNKTDATRNELNDDDIGIGHVVAHTNAAGAPEEEDEMQSMDRRRKRRRTTAYYATSENDDGCASCDPSCLRCYGPLSSQCSTCFPGNQLRKPKHTNETYCYSFAERSSGNSQDGDGSNVSSTSVKNGVGGSHIVWLLLAAMAVVTLSIILFLATIGRRYQLPCRRSGVGTAAGASTSGLGVATYAYDRVALLPDDEDDNDNDDDADAEVDVFTAPIASSVSVVYKHKADSTKVTAPVIIDFVAESEEEQDKEPDENEAQHDIYNIAS